MGSSVVLFDGVCNLCNGTVQWLIKRDKKNKLKYSALQGRFAAETITDGRLKQTDSIVFFHLGRFYVKSTGVLTILKVLGWPWNSLYIFIVVPRFIRDAVYDFVAANRYKWFGKREACLLPTPELKERFLE